MAEYNMILTGIEVIPELDNHINVVRRVHLRYEGIYEDSKSFVPLTVDLDNPDENFVEFENITREHIDEWISNRIGIDGLQSLLESQRNSELMPLTIMKSPPWEG